MAMTILCPFDGLDMEAKEPELRKDEKPSDNASKKGGHVHYDLKATLVCPDGHTWTVDTDIILFREDVKDGDL